MSRDEENHPLPGASSAAAGPYDASVSRGQFEQAIAHLARVQQETMQDVHQMQITLTRYLQQQTSSTNTNTPPSSAGTLSSASSSTPTNTINVSPPAQPVPNHLKLAKPSLFTGVGKANVETWLFEVEHYLVAYGVVIDGQRIAFAAASLKGLALQWWQSRCYDHPDEQLTWIEFKKKVQERFQPVEAARTARDNLRALKQGNKSVTDYCSLFYEQLQMIHDMSEADKIQNFMYGLQPWIYKEVDQRDPQTLEKAMASAQRAETRGKVRVSNVGAAAGSFAASHWKNFPHHHRPANQTHQRVLGEAHSSNSNVGSVPMELGNVGFEVEDEEDETEQEWHEYLNELESQEIDSEEERKENAMREQQEAEEETEQLQAITTRSKPGRVPNLSKEEWYRLRREGKCFRCKRPGHLGRDCPLARRNNARPFQANNSK